MTDHPTVFPFEHFAAYLPAHNPSFGNPTFDDAGYRILIARLSPFRDVDRSLPHLFLYQEVRRALPGAYIDLAFLPTAHEREALSEHGLPYLIGTQSRRPARAFDLVLISNAYTLELINLPYLLLRSGIPLYVSQRGEAGWPLLVLGGSNALAAQGIITPGGDSLVDAVFFGEGEGYVARLVALLAQRDDDARARLQDAAQAIDGLWVAGAFQHTAKAVCTPHASLLPVEVPLLNSPEVHTANLQISYGCPAFCSFCFEGYDRKPYREIPLPDLIDAARRLKRAQGVQEVNLYSFNFNTHREILPLLLALHRLYYRVGIKSQRVDILQHTDPLLEAEVEAGKRSFTLGIEGISERQRTWLHKSLPTADITGLLDRLLRLKVREVKLFYLLTGHETEDDLAEFRAYLRALKATRRARNPGIRIIFSFGLLVRMPYTPLRYDRLFLDESAWRPLIGQVKSACETNGFEFRMAFDWASYCVTQVLALGGYWLHEPLVELAREGFCYDETLEEAYWTRLQRWMVEAGHWNEALLRQKGPDYGFALGFVESDVTDRFLYRQYQEAQEGLDSGYCLGSECLACGACDGEAQREAITGHQVQSPERSPYLAQLREVVDRKRHLQPAYYVLRLGGRDAGSHLTGLEVAYLNALAFRALLALYPSLLENLLAVQERLFTAPPPPPGKGRRRAKRGRFPTMGGESVYALYAWDIESLHETLSGEREGPEHALQVVRPAEDFEPGTFTRLDIKVTLPEAHFPGARRELEAYLREAYVPYSLRRESPQGEHPRRYRFEVPQKGLRKKVLLGGTMTASEAGLVAQLHVGPRFDLLQFLERFGPAYHVPYAGLWVSKVEWS